MGKSLFLLDLKSWKPSRQLIAPVFTSASMKKIEKIFADSTEIIMNEIENFSVSGIPFDIKLLFESFVLSNTLKAFFAAKITSQNNHLVLNSRKIFMKNITFEQYVALFSPTLSKLFGLRFLDRNATDFMTQLIETIINERKQKNYKSNDLLQALLDATYFNDENSSKMSEYSKNVTNNINLLEYNL